jgi:hypothetical protein
LKLQAGNPNLMKKAATRVNAHASSPHAFPPVLGDKGQACMRSTGELLMPKDPNAALPNTISIWDLETYKPPKNEYVRPGANDFLRYKSRGI